MNGEGKTSLYGLNMQKDFFNTLQGDSFRPEDLDDGHEVPAEVLDYFSEVLHDDVVVGVQQVPRKKRVAAQHVGEKSALIFDADSLDGTLLEELLVLLETYLVNEVMRVNPGEQELQGDLPVYSELLEGVVGQEVEILTGLFGDEQLVELGYLFLERKPVEVEALFVLGVQHHLQVVVEHRRQDLQIFGADFESAPYLYNQRDFIVVVIVVELLSVEALLDLLFDEYHFSRDLLAELVSEHPERRQVLL